MTFFVPFACLCNVFYPRLLCFVIFWITWLLLFFEVCVLSWTLQKLTLQWLVLSQQTKQTLITNEWQVRGVVDNSDTAHTHTKKRHKQAWREKQTEVWRECPMREYRKEVSLVIRPKDSSPCPPTEVHSVLGQQLVSFPWWKPSDGAGKSGGGLGGCPSTPAVQAFW